jgi:protoporphyrinogen oxidase
MVEPTHVVILGAGPAGVGAAFQLHRTGRASAAVVEQREVVGGNAGSFEIEGQRVDYGSHRLHPSCKPEILSDIRSLLGGELVKRPRHGRIRLSGRWIHFPLRPLDLGLRLDRGFTFGALRDMAARSVGRGPDEGDSFAGVLRSHLGPTVYDRFYGPYAKKIWGVEPEDLSAEQARRRVAADTPGKLLRKMLGRLPGMKPVGFRHFYYPRRGYGAISEAYAAAAEEQGAELHLGWRIEKVERPPAPGERWRVVARRGEDRRSIEGNHVWSTIPIPLLARLLSPSPPESVLEASEGIDYRAMLLVYLTLPVERFTEFDAHYFPEPEVALTRLSEPKNYTDAGEPRGRTTICAELPCSTDDAWWGSSDAEMGERVAADLERVGLPLPARPGTVTVRRLAQAYPIYRRGYEAPFTRLDRWLGELPGLLSFGRQGLFAHDNTHHALAMAYAAADCLRDGVFDRERWSAYRKEFEAHVVED